MVAQEALAEFGLSSGVAAPSLTNGAAQHDKVARDREPDTLSTTTTTFQ